jgi:uncharacterized protein (DUF1501 family)
MVEDGTDGGTVLENRCRRAVECVERGVPWVLVTSGGWDDHEDLEAGLGQRLELLDRAFSRLLTDLDDRGLFDSTLVLVMSDFGRNPRMNDRGGRGHWPNAGVFLRAGGSARYRGVLGSTCSEGAGVVGVPDNPLLLLTHSVEKHFGDFLRPRFPAS